MGTFCEQTIIIIIILHLNNLSMECHPKGAFKDAFLMAAVGACGFHCRRPGGHPGAAIDADVRWRLVTLPLMRGPFSGHVVAFPSPARNSEGVLLHFNTTIHCIFVEYMEACESRLHLSSGSWLSFRNIRDRNSSSSVSQEMRTSAGLVELCSKSR